jgi:hypothetical protein
MRAVSLIRWCRPGLIAVAVCGLAVASRAENVGSDIVPEMQASLRKAFAYQASAAADPAPVKAEPGVILLPRMVVRNRFEAEGLDAAIARQNAIDDRFTLYKGGVIAGPVGVWYQDDDKDPAIPGRPIRGLNFFKLSW